MYSNKKVIHIVAVATNGVIGKDGDLCWRLSEDLQYFKEQTLGHVCLAGRKTVESFPKPLERRVVEEVTTKWNRMYGGNLSHWEVLCMQLSGAVDFSNKLNTDKIFIIGGSQLYKATEQFVDELWITEIDSEFDGDTFYSKPEGYTMYDHTDWMKGTCKKTMKTLSYRFTKWCKN